MLKLLKDEIVFYQGGKYAISKVLADMKHIQIRDVKTGQIQRVEIIDVTSNEIATEAGDPKYDRTIDAFTQEELERAQVRFNIIQPFLTEMRGNKAELMRVAKEHGYNASTLYNWIFRYETCGHIGGLVDSEGRGGKGGKRLKDEKLEELISEVINDIYLGGKSVNNTFNKIKMLCEDLDLKVPHISTIRRRIKNIPEYERVKRREGANTADKKHGARPGHFPGATTPLSVVQVDHTILDIFLVDDDEREPFKRPWLTVLMDVFSRMVLGFYLSFDAPGAFGTGRAIANSILPKEKFLKSLGVDGDWPCWGKMVSIHCDNAKEFRGNMLKDACLAYNIDLKFRPVRKPVYGSHIERLMGTFATEIADLDGATKVSKEKRSHKHPEKNANMTLDEFEVWLTRFITNIYHKRSHRGINMSPYDKWMEGIWGSGDQLGIGTPPERISGIQEEIKLRLDLAPHEERTIQVDGVSIGGLTYFNDLFRPWVGKKEVDKDGKTLRSKKFKFKYDPRDLSCIYWLDPTGRIYHEIKYLDPKGIPMDKWELKKIKASLAEKNIPVNDESIFKAKRENDELKEAAKKKTVETKKMLARKKRKATEAVAKPAASTSSSKPSRFKINSTTEIKPFDELDYGKRIFK
jgi:putative transposase